MTWAGNIQDASSREMAKAITTTMGTTRIKSPKIPGSKINGPNAAIVVSTAAVTGADTSLSAPSTAVI